MASDSFRFPKPVPSGQPDVIARAMTENLRALEVWLNAKLTVSADHTAALHDALGLSHDSLVDVSSDDHHAQSHAHDGLDGSGTVEHSALTGLTDDDHTQYLLIDGTRAMTGALDMDGQAINNILNAYTRTIQAVNTAGIAVRDSTGLLKVRFDDASISGDINFYDGTGEGFPTLVWDNSDDRWEFRARPYSTADAQLLEVEGHTHLETDITDLAHTTDHGALSGLADDDHVQYYNAARHTKAVHDALAIDHGSLAGLTDDDHTQYLLVAGTRAMTGNLDLGGNRIDDSQGTYIELRKTSAQTFSDATFTDIDWDSVSVSHGASAWDDVGGTNPDRITPDQAGVYLVVANIYFTNNSTGDYQATIRKNGSSTGFYVREPSSTFRRFQVTGTVQCNGTTDYITVAAEQNSGGNLNLQGTAQTRVSVVRIA